MSTTILERKQLQTWLNNRRQQLFRELEVAIENQGEKYPFLIIGQLIILRETLDFIEEQQQHD